MPTSEWTPRTSEDRLLALYLAANPGYLFLKVKTHANMGNLFGWIYGDMPEEFREATWARYVGALIDGEGPTLSDTPQFR